MADGMKRAFAAARSTQLGKRIFTCGTRAVHQRGPADFRVVCATCFGGGTVRHPTDDNAKRACTRDSNQPCSNCGAR